jgi:lipoprotein-anchoring transpeptidase ErfK/SrfK
MSADYYSLLTKAIAGRDAIARGKIYKDAYDLIQRSNLSREDSSRYVAALEDAVQRIENDIAAGNQSDETSAAAVDRVLSTRLNWVPLLASAAAVMAVLALSAVLYNFISTKTPRGVTAASSRPAAGFTESVVADLEPGKDGGSSAAGLPYALQRQVVFYRTTIVPGSVVVDRESRFLYLIDTNNSARRYGIGIAQECLKGGSLFRIANKVEWPVLRPSGTDGNAPAQSAATGRLGNPLGSRALFLDKPGLLIHGTNSPQTIGHLVASGCIRLVNEDVEDLYRRVPLDTRVVFVS